MPEEIDLSGKIALITGASKGIGAAVAKSYAKSGAHVILVARNVAALEKIDDEIQAQGGTATLIPLDLMDLNAIDKMGPSIYQRFGKLDIFVGNAGVLPPLKPLSQVGDLEFQQALDVNLSANFRLIKTLDPLLQKSEAGRAIFVSTSEGVTKGRAYWGAYAISKAGLETMARIYAAENEKSNLRINIIHPGAVRTDMRAEAKPGEDPMTLPAPEEVTDKFLELASSKCKIHGEVIEAN